MFESLHRILEKTPIEISQTLITNMPTQIKRIGGDIRF